jgi:cyclomaltodextrin glucanotransferase
MATMHKGHRKPSIPLTLVLLIGVWLTASGAAQQATDYRARTIYFLLADRFNPHHPYNPYVDPEHPDATNTVNCFEQPCDFEEEWRRYWGGDLQGILEKLDYLQRLGISAIWVTPLMENVRAFEPSGPVHPAWGAAHHGYWVQNYYRVNPHFGSWDDVQQLSRELHARGMRYVQDITLNHSNPLDTHAYGRLYQSSDADQIFIDSYENDYDPVYPTRFYKHYQDDPSCQQAATIPDYQWSYWQLHHCLLADLSGYNQRDPLMSQYLINAGKTWIDHGVDDFRFDAIKFPFPEFVTTFTHAMIHYLGSLGRPAPYLVGEWSHGGVGDPKSLRFANDFARYATNILDFALSLALNQFIGGASEATSQQLSAQGLDQLLHERVAAFHGRDTWQGTFIDNHDQMRTLVRLHKLGIDSETDRQRRMDLATVLLLTVRGIPILFYGDEQYLARYVDCDPRHPDYCDVAPEDVNSHDDDPYNRGGLAQWSEETPAFKIIATLANLRQKSPAIAQGDYRTLYADQDVLVFERRYRQEVVIVAVNRGDDTTIAIQKRLDLTPGHYTGLLTQTSEVNQGNFLAVPPEGQATMYLGRLSSLVVWSQAPQP